MLPPLRILIVDDEPLARQRIRTLLETFAVDIVGEATNGSEGLLQARTLRPDAVFFDINMPELDGFAAAEALLESGDPQIVFLTAHQEFAARAFELDVCDYLVKPVGRERIGKTLARLSQRLGRHTRKNETNEPTISVTDRRGQRFLRASECDRFRAEEKYVVLNAGKEEHLLRESLDELETLLCDHGFVRVHRSELIAAREIRALERDEFGWFVRLGDAQTVRVSRRRLTEVRTALTEMRNPKQT